MATVLAADFTGPPGSSLDSAGTMKAHDENDAAQNVRNVIGSTGAHKAEAIRATFHALGHDNEIENLAKKSQFDPFEMFKSFLYELLPPVFCSPIACCVLEPSPIAGYYVSVHRSLLPSTSKHTGPVLQFMLFTAIPHWLVSTSVIMRVAMALDGSSVDIYELFLSYSWLIARWAVISLKYAYFPKRHLGAMRLPPPSWSQKKQSETLILGVWSTPPVDLLRQMVTTAQEIADVDLGAVTFSLNVDQSKALLAAIRSHHEEKYTISTTGEMEARGLITAEDLLLQIVTTAFAEPLRTIFWVPIFITIVMITFGPGLMRLYFGQPMFGSTPQDITIYCGMIYASFVGSLSVLMFCVTVAG